MITVQGQKITKASVKKMKSGEWFEVQSYEATKAISLLPLGISFRKEYFSCNGECLGHPPATGKEMVEYTVVRYVIN